MPLFYVVLIASFLALSPTSWVLANQPASPSDSLATSEQDAIDSINQLSSSDGPEIQSRVTGSSELTGIMVDRTITMAGKTFYRAFSQRAMDNLLIGNATLTIQERPDARWGSQVWIMEGNRMYFRTQLSPRISEADLVAGEAVQIVEEALLQHQLASALTSDKDLGREELF
ncbi:CsgE family curli-type amyloid fiber assembly protein [Halomonas sp. M1]|uniref:CsgE family curli-type amyloid fiber assembly protein n=1 Tax=Halomonas sp. M1 TaxID=3035470 RepID=UPI002485C241|nr:CsgE family curli-type amyloid fiber assembly protein [Halomonas sp. M1]WFE70375.1 CsgE family curli-type amyloid fiber assembly protein [Halomonas sp. M1]